MSVGFQSVDGCTRIGRKLEFRFGEFEDTHTYALNHLTVPIITIVSLSRFEPFDRGLWSSFLHRHPLVTTMYTEPTESKDLEVFLSALVPQDPSDSTAGELDEPTLPNLCRLCIGSSPRGLGGMRQLSLLDDAHEVTRLLEPVILGRARMKVPLAEVELSVFLVDANAAEIPPLRELLKDAGIATQVLRGKEHV